MSLAEMPGVRVKMAVNKKKNKMLSAVLTRLRELLPILSYQRVPQICHTTTLLPLPHLTPAKIADVYERLGKLYDLYLQRYRQSGNMLLPVPVELNANGIKVAYSHSTASELNIEKVSSALTPEDIDILLRTLLAQLNQLRELNYVHGSLSPEALPIQNRGEHWAFSLLGIEHGCFRDEPLGSEAQSESDWSSPEKWRRQHFNTACAPSYEDDMFAVGCLYFELLTGGKLLGPNGLLPGAVIARGIPLSVDMPHGPREELIRWALEPDPNGRPSFDQALASLAALNQAPSVQEAEHTEYILPSLAHSAEQCLMPFGNRQLAIARRMAWLWRPDHRSLPNVPAPLFERQLKFCVREESRLSSLCELSRTWNEACSSIPPCDMEINSDGIIVMSPLPPGQLMMLGQFPKRVDSRFLRDARMVDLLLAISVLHDDGWILGLISEDRFCIQSSPSGGQTWLLDFSGAMPLNSLPRPEDIRPDAAAGALLSPELAQYIVSSSSKERQLIENWLSPASDIFSLGLLYHLILTGHLPVLRSSLSYSFADAVWFAKYPQQAIELDSCLDRQHSNLIYQMLMADPAERPEDCSAIASCILGFYTA